MQVGVCIHWTTALHSNVDYQNKGAADAKVTTQSQNHSQIYVSGCSHIIIVLVFSMHFPVTLQQSLKVPYFRITALHGKLLAEH